MNIFRNTRILALAVLSITMLSLGACETIDGAGRDIENAGEAVQDAAN